MYLWKTNIPIKKLIFLKCKLMLSISILMTAYKSINSLIKNNKLKKL